MHSYKSITKRSKCMSKVELGNKHLCASCNTKFYEELDFQKAPTKSGSAPFSRQSIPSCTFQKRPFPDVA